ncbi:hypothetical protein CTT30_00855 [Vibrio coralliilyticus]|nr:hypothetical protein CTT30_00855 [Vibrio coralliilyticus]
MICQYSLKVEMKKLVIFDLDDTIYPEQQYNLACYRAAADRFLEDYSVDIYPYIEEQFKKKNYQNLFCLALENAGIACSEDYIFNVLVQTYRSFKPELTPYKGFNEYIEKLKEKFQLAIITDGPLDIQKSKVNALGIASDFDLILCSSELGDNVKKPSSEPFEYVLSKLKVHHQDSVYIGDNIKKDFVYPNHSGMHSIHLSNKSENDNLIYESQVGEAAHHYCESYDELYLLLHQIFNDGK